MTRVAAVDLGTNSTRLLVADVEGERLDEVVRRLTITRLGEGVDERRRLLPVPIARVRNTLADYRRELEEIGATRTLAIGTSALRDAENGEAFLGEIEWSYGFETRLLDGIEEASMMLRGVAAGREARSRRRSWWTSAGARPSSSSRRTAPCPKPSASTSAACGSPSDSSRRIHLRPTSSPPLPATYAGSSPCDPRGRLSVSPARYDSRHARPRPRRVRPQRTHGHRISRAAVDRELARLAAMTLQERAAVPGIEPGRAPVIVAGLVILREVLDAYDLSEIEVSERDILHGAALAAAELPEREEGAAPPGAYTCC